MNSRPLTPFSVDDILRINPSNSSDKNKSKKPPSNESISLNTASRPLTPFFIEDILSKVPSNNSTNVDGRPNTPFSENDSLRTEPMTASENSSANTQGKFSKHRLRMQRTKSSESICNKKNPVSLENDELSCYLYMYSENSSPIPGTARSTPMYHVYNFRNLQAVNHNENYSAASNGEVDIGHSRMTASRYPSLQNIQDGFAFKKRSQVRFSEEQIAVMEKNFLEQMYISPEQRRIIASQIQLSEKQVKTWFQNRRAKWKKCSTVKSVTRGPIAQTEAGIKT